MTEERMMLTSFEANDCESDCITLGDNSQGKVLGFGKIAITTKHSISKVFLLNRWTTICYLFHSFVRWVIIVCSPIRIDGSFAFKGVLRGNLYLVDFIPKEVELDRCLIAKTNMGWLWRGRLAHVGMRNLHKLQKDGPILGQISIVFGKDRLCRAHQARKQVVAQHHAKNIMATTKPLEMQHMDLFGPVAYISIGGNKYGLVIVDDYCCFTWVFFCKIRVKLKKC
jgi:hypothetical protein